MVVTGVKKARSEVLIPIRRWGKVERVLVRRLLPVTSEILVHVGEQVVPDQVIARFAGRKEYHIIDVAAHLALPAADLSRVMAKLPGEWVEAGETIAARTGVLPFLYKPCRAPVAGKLRAIARGWVVLETTQPVEDNAVTALVDGRVVEVTDGGEVCVEVVANVFDAAWATGPETAGLLRMGTAEPGAILEADDIDAGCEGAVLVGGRGISAAAVRHAEQVGVRAVVVGSIDSTAAGAADNERMTIVATEGYGDLAMPRALFETLSQLDGRPVSVINLDSWGSTWRPALLMPVLEPDAGIDLQSDRAGLEIGDRCQLVREPYAGAVGEVVGISNRAVRTATGFSLGAVSLQLENDIGEGAADRRVSVPWPNLERLI